MRCLISLIFGHYDYIEVVAQKHYRETDFKGIGNNSSKAETFKHLLPQSIVIHILHYNPVLTRICDV